MNEPIESITNDEYIKEIENKKKYRIVSYIRIEPEDLEEDILYNSEQDAEIALHDEYNEQDGVILRIEDVDE